MTFTDDFNAGTPGSALAGSSYAGISEMVYSADGRGSTVGIEDAGAPNGSSAYFQYTEADTDTLVAQIDFLYTSGTGGFPSSGAIGAGGIIYLYGVSPVNGPLSDILQYDVGVDSGGGYHTLTDYVTPRYSVYPLSAGGWTATFSDPGRSKPAFDEWRTARATLTDGTLTFEILGPDGTTVIWSYEIDMTGWLVSGCYVGLGHDNTYNRKVVGDNFSYVTTDPVPPPLPEPPHSVDIVMLNGPTDDMPHAEVHLGAFAIPPPGETGDRSISFQTRISANKSCWARLHAQWYERGSGDTLNAESTDPLTPVIRLGGRAVTIQRTSTSADHTFRVVFTMADGRQWDMPDPNGTGEGGLHSLPTDDPSEVGVIFTDVTSGETWTYPDPVHIRRAQTDVKSYTWSFDDGSGDGDFNDLIVEMNEGPQSPSILNIFQIVDNESATHWRPYFEFWGEDPRTGPEVGLPSGTFIQMEGLYLPDNGLSLSGREYLDGDQSYGIWEGTPRRSTSIYGEKPPPADVVIGEAFVIPAPAEGA